MTVNNDYYFFSNHKSGKKKIKNNHSLFFSLKNIIPSRFGAIYQIFWVFNYIYL